MGEASPSRLCVRIAAAGLTDIGRQRRHNEDHILVKSELGLFAVADGMGGHNAGDVASKLAATSLWNFFEATTEGKLPGLEPGEEGSLSREAGRLAAGIRKANHDVFEISCTYHQHSGMGSTIVAIHVDADEGQVHVGHVGDSRCYRIREGKIELLTRDHSLVNDALDLKPDLSEEELSRLPRNIITRALGMKAAVKVDLRSEATRAGDVFLLCSDGLSGLIEDEHILEVFEITDDLKEACELLIAMANDAGGTDNISAVVVRVEQGDDERIERESSPRSDDGASHGDSGEIARRPSLVGESSDDAPISNPLKRLKGKVPDGVVELLRAGAEVDLSADTLMSIPAEVRVARCKKCNTELFVGNLFCVECGTPIA